MQLLSGEVQILAQRHSEALRLLKELDRTRDDLKGGWHRGPHGEQVPHWSFVDADIQVIADLPSMLRAFRFEPFVLAASGDIYGVELIGCTRKRGDELVVWQVLAPFVEPGGRMDWYGENGAVVRWRFDGQRLTVVPGSLAFADESRSLFARLLGRKP